MFRVQMKVLRHNSIGGVLEWFVLSDEYGQWRVIVSEDGDRIFSFAVDVHDGERTKTATLAARLWPKLLAEGVRLDYDTGAPTYLQAEVRVRSGVRRWAQASTWLWHKGKVAACRSHPVIRCSSTFVDADSPELIAAKCFAFAAELEAD